MLATAHLLTLGSVADFGSGQLLGFHHERAA
jgi:hypothetical protein